VQDEALRPGTALRAIAQERIQRDVKELHFLISEVAEEHGCSEQLVTYSDPAIEAPEPLFNGTAIQRMRAPCHRRRGYQAHAKAPSVGAAV
jgi:hypothetical protein